MRTPSMTDTPQTYLEKVSAACARPILSDPQHRVAFLYRLQAYWTRQLNAHRKGKPTQFPPDDIHYILDELQTLLIHERSAQ